MGNGKDLYRGIKEGGYQWLIHYGMILSNYGMILSIRMCCKAMAL